MLNAIIAHAHKCAEYFKKLSQLSLGPYERAYFSKGILVSRHLVDMSNFAIDDHNQSSWNNVIHTNVTLRQRGLTQKFEVYNQQNDIDKCEKKPCEK